MEFRSLGQGPLQISVVSLGAMPWGGGFTREVKVDETLARRLVDVAIDGGVNLIDTAESYGGGPGRSEEVLGRVIKGRRDKVLLATKVGFNDMGPGALRPEKVIVACEASLGHLGVDHIDLYQLHRADRAVPLEETLGALDELVRRGLIRQFGVSNFRAWEVADANGRLRALGKPTIVSMQVHYSLVFRDIEHEILPFCRACEVSTIIFSPLAGGQLSSMEDSPSASGRRRFGALPDVKGRGLAAVRTVLGTIARERRVSMSQVALAWALAQPGVTTVLTGPTTAEQLEDNIAAADLKLGTQELSALSDATAIEKVYPSSLDESAGFQTP
jgi:aryl-alcohol dehydrogenase-like predicted oxidoreductase